MKLRLMGIKQGMMQLFDKEGNKVMCTVISTEKHVVTQVKRQESDCYDALQLAFGKVKPSKVRGVTKAISGHCKKAGVEPRKYFIESRLDNVDAYQVGQELGIDLFADVTYVDVQGTSKGKGHQGVIKRHNFAGGPAAHGSGFHRHGGSCGMRTSPGRCLPGQKKSGRMGGETVTVANLRIVKIDADRGILLVEGAVPGARGGVVTITSAKKKPAKKA
jgi:large subunit ribosomal protein L3